MAQQQQPQRIVQTTLHGTTVPGSLEFRGGPSSVPEPPTHHDLDHDALSTWVYPTNIGTIRDYQYNIVSRALFHNLLVALPTGMGKTFIAATVMLNWYRWTKSAQIVFVAPTKPLVTQQVDACFGIAGIPRSQTAAMTGGISPGVRADEWLKRRVFFMTPQTLINDLKTGICDPKRIVLIVVDEAHRATGAYAYVEVVKFISRFNDSFRVLALTATPGSDIEGVQEVIDGLRIARVEIRTENSLDIRQYVHRREVEKVVFDQSPEFEMLKTLYSNALQPLADIIVKHGVYWRSDPSTFTAFGLTQARQKWMAGSGQHQSFPVKNMVNAAVTTLASLSHGMELLKYYGAIPFFTKMNNFRKETAAKGTKAGKYRLMINNHPDFDLMMSRLSMWAKDKDFAGHPKLDYLKSCLSNHFLDAGDGAESATVTSSSTKVIVFAHFRDSAEDIMRVLKPLTPLIRPHVFVGQQTSKNSDGMDQKTQLAVMAKFRTGEINTLIATSIGEEGLDIGEVDLIVCYDSKASPLRMLQRMGRTGRKRRGQIILLQMRGKEEEDAEKARAGYEHMQEQIALGDKFNFHNDTDRRILPAGIMPVVDKRAVEIPIENTQTTGADVVEELSRKRPKKRPPKKFNMPDGVQTGFVSAASLMPGLVDNRGGRQLKLSEYANSSARRVGPKLDPAPIPQLSEVTLTPAQTVDLAVRYQHAVSHGGTGPGDDGEITVGMPALDLHPEFQRRPSKAVLFTSGNRNRMKGGLAALLGRMARTADRFGDVTERDLIDRWMGDEEDDRRDCVVKAATVKTRTETQPARRTQSGPPSRSNLKRTRSAASTPSNLFDLEASDDDDDIDAVDLRAGSVRLPSHATTAANRRSSSFADLAYLDDDDDLPDLGEDLTKPSSVVGYDSDNEYDEGDGFVVDDDDIAAITANEKKRSGKGGRRTKKLRQGRARSKTDVGDSLMSDGSTDGEVELLKTPKMKKDTKSAPSRSGVEFGMLDSSPPMIEAIINSAKPATKGRPSRAARLESSQADLPDVDAILAPSDEDDLDYLNHDVGTKPKDGVVGNGGGDSAPKTGGTPSRRPGSGRRNRPSDDTSTTAVETRSSDELDDIDELVRAPTTPVPKARGGGRSKDGTATTTTAGKVVKKKSSGAGVPKAGSKAGTTSKPKTKTITRGDIAVVLPSTPERMKASNSTLR